MTTLILRLVNFLLSLLVETDDQAGRIDNALKDIERTLDLQRRKAAVLGDFSGKKDCNDALLRVIVVRVELKRRGKPRVRVPRIKVVWPG